MLKCIQPGCGRTGDDIGLCGSKLLCPPLINPEIGVQEVQTGGLDVVVECVPCGITRVYTTASLMARPVDHGRLCQGSLDHCQARAHTVASPTPASDFVPEVLQVAPKAVRRTKPATE